MLLKDKVAVVTGGGRGIGRAIALAYAQEGANLVLASRSLEALEETRNALTPLGREVLVVQTDIRDADSVQALATRTLAHFGHIDILVNNSGIAGPTAPLWEITPQDWQETFAVNSTGTYLCCRAFLPAMIERQAGQHRYHRLNDRETSVGWAHTLCCQQDGRAGVGQNTGLGGGRIQHSRQRNLSWPCRRRAHRLGLSQTGGGKGH